MSSVTPSQTGVSGSIKLQYVDANGNTQNVPFPLPTAPARGVASRNPSLKQIIFFDDFTAPSGMYNDGSALMTCSRDWDIMFCGKPSLRLDTQGVNSGLSSPQAQPNQSGIVFKGRMGGLAAPGGTPAGILPSVYGLEFWMRFTDVNTVGNVNNIFSTSIYSRDSATGNFRGGRIWFNTSGTNVSMQYLDGNTSNYVEMFQYYVPNAVWNIDVLGGAADRAGVWNYVKFVVDLNLQQYVSFQFNEAIASTSTSLFALGGKPLLNAASSGTNNAVHFSIEYATNSATRRTINVAQMIGTIEG